MGERVSDFVENTCDVFFINDELIARGEPDEASEEWHYCR